MVSLKNDLSDKLNRHNRRKPFFTKDRLKDHKHVVEVGDYILGNHKVICLKEKATLIV